MNCTATNIATGELHSTVPCWWEEISSAHRSPNPFIVSGQTRDLSPLADPTESKPCSSAVYQCPQPFTCSSWPDILATGRVNAWRHLLRIVLSRSSSSSLASSAWHATSCHTGDQWLKSIKSKALILDLDQMLLPQPHICGHHPECPSSCG